MSVMRLTPHNTVLFLEFANCKGEVYNDRGLLVDSFAVFQKDDGPLIHKTIEFLSATTKYRMKRSVLDLSFRSCIEKALGRSITHDFHKFRFRLREYNPNIDDRVDQSAFSRGFITDASSSESTNREELQDKQLYADFHEEKIWFQEVFPV